MSEEEEFDDPSVRIGLTRRVYEGVRALLAVDQPLNVEPSPPDGSDLLTVCERMLASDEVEVISGGPMLIVDVSRRLGEVGFYCAGLRGDGLVAGAYLYFVEPGDPPAVRRLPFTKKMQIVDPSTLVRTVNPELWSELMEAAMVLIDLVQERVDKDVPIAIAPVEVMDDQEIRDAVDNFNVVACMVSSRIRHKLALSDSFIRDYRRQFPNLDSGAFEMGRD